MKYISLLIIICLSFVFSSCGGNETPKGISYTVVNGYYTPLKFTEKKQTETGQRIYSFQMFDTTIDIISEIIAAHKSKQQYRKIVYLNKDMPKKEINVMPGVNFKVTYNGGGKLKKYISYIPYQDTQKIKKEIKSREDIQPEFDTVTLSFEGDIPKDKNIKFILMWNRNLDSDFDLLKFLK